MRLYRQAFNRLRGMFRAERRSPATCSQGFYLGRGSTTAGAAHLVMRVVALQLGGARQECNQLDQRYRGLREKATPSLPPATTAPPSAAGCRDDGHRPRRRSGDRPR